MTMDAFLQQTVDGTAERNAMLAIVLGLISVDLRLQGLLDRYAPSKEVLDGLPEENDPFTFLVLGLIAVHSRFTQILDQAPPLILANPRDADRFSLRDLLR